ncbi:MAG: heme-copper oxidase subunit III [Chloroflexaceae bacterium]|nr:heme-copper oxidase subunit III [Chloroflexaceae bacterium]
MRQTLPRSQPSEQLRARNARTSIWLVLISELMLFFGLLSSFFFLRGALPEWGPPSGQSYDLTLPIITSVILFASAGTMHLAYRAIQHDQRQRFEQMLTVTMLLGALFIVGQIYEFSTIGFNFQDGAYAAIVLLTIGTHAAHVAIGVLIFVVVHIRASLGLFNAQRHMAVEMCALYWYFVALIWVVIFAILFFL